MDSRRVTADGRSLVVEVVGVAGCGKSTATRLLCARPGWSRADGLHTRNQAHWGLVARAAPRVTPLALASVVAPPTLSWEELKDAMYVTSWRGYLSRNHRDGVTVLDQGPLFALARMLWNDKPVTRTARFEHWLDSTLDAWLRTLDLIVWLDAPSNVLFRRINTRAQPHAAKGLDATGALAVFAPHRRAYERLIERVTATGGVTVLQLDTSRAAPVETAHAIAAAVEELAHPTTTERATPAPALVAG